jgi:hypothetical protein
MGEQAVDRGSSDDERRGDPELSQRQPLPELVHEEERIMLVLTR